MRSKLLISVAKGLVMAVVFAGMLLLQLGVRIIYGFGELGGQEVPPDERAKFGEVNAWVCAMAAFVAAALAILSFVEQIWSKHREQVPGDRGPGGLTATEASVRTVLEVLTYITMTVIIAGWGVWTTLSYRQG